MQRWKAAALASVLCSSVLSLWICREGLLLGRRLGPALAPLRRPPRTLDARIARLAQCKLCPAPGGHRGGVAGPAFQMGGEELANPPPPAGLAGGAGEAGCWQPGSLSLAVTRN